MRILRRTRAIFLISLLIALPAMAQDADTRLIQAAKTGDTAAAVKALDEGADLEARDEEYKATPLLHAAAKGHPETVQALIDKGADLGATDKYGLTAKALAVMFGHFDVVKVLNKAQEAKK